MRTLLRSLTRLAASAPPRRRLAPGWIAGVAALSVAAGCIALAHAEAAQATLKTEDVTIFVKEQQTFSPGYAVGDIAIGDPAVADFKVMGGRRELVIFGKEKGETRLTLWDQKGVKRHDVHIKVSLREEVKAETDLRALVKPFSTVEVGKLGEQLVLTGTVATDADMDAITRISGAANAQNLVRLVKANSLGGIAAPIGPSTGGETAPGPGAPGPGGTTAAPPQVEYEVELLEAHVAFGSGTYGIGIEPSGRTLYKSTVRAAFNGDTDVAIPGPATLGPKADKKLQNVVNLRLKLRPTALSEEGELTTFVSIETNVPVEGSKDPTVTRRARWELVSKTDEPFGLGGGELLAMPQVYRGTSRLGRMLAAAGSTAGTVGVVPGVSNYTGYVPSYMPYYDKEKKTQLLAIFRPKLVRPAAK